ncbi:integrase DNA-binding domain-containing protein [Ruoffia tabacinasalis]|uniref:Integrase DNA-binding domain-containing protein n=1 Tax=Ruoffia tabacinasalis TaxID=87458 RepID=A0ABS0LMP4_9LACT|nr:integrase DNA-binding domain-containing protein [Ruoffia tabacinasalis]MBG9979372.1 integrase DNA-binding domain-containing protein [Ruoffia tabacinasalis]
MKRRKNSKGLVLRNRESERKNGYQYRWIDDQGKRKYLYAKTLQELRLKEEQLQKKMLMGIRSSGRGVKLNQVYNSWFSTKIGLRPTSKDCYIGLYNTHIRNYMGEWEISKIK